MADLNTITLSGNLTKDPELRTVGKDSKSVARLRVASKIYGDRSLFIDVSVWDKLGEIVAEAYSKGSPIVLVGQLQSREYEKDGQNRVAYEITARDIKLPPKSKTDAAPDDDDDIIF